MSRKEFGFMPRETAPPMLAGAVTISNAELIKEY